MTTGHITVSAQIVSADGRARIMVESTETGPTEREHAVVLRELAEPEYGGFYWGYSGGGPGRASSAILADALGLGDPDECGLGPLSHPRNDIFIALRNDFCWDVLSQLCEEWRLRRGAVLRWVRGWYAERGITALPQAVGQLPPIDPHAR